MRDALAGEHGCARKDPLASGDRVLEVVEELEVSFPQLEQRHVGWRANIERAAVVEQGEYARGIDGRARDRFTERHPVTEELRHAVGKVDDPRLMTRRGPVSRERIGPETCLHDGADGVPSHMSGLSVADIEPD